MNLKRLRDALDKMLTDGVPAAAPVYLSADSEGNEFRPLGEALVGTVAGGPLVEVPNRRTAEPPAVEAVVLWPK